VGGALWAAVEAALADGYLARGNPLLRVAAE
jgi:hypothetical protein